MADQEQDYLKEQQEVMSQLQKMHDKDTHNEQSKASYSQYGGEPTAIADTFAKYYQSRHDSSGRGSYSNPQLSWTEKASMDDYEQRRAYEQQLRNDGMTEPDIALQRKWDAAFNQAALGGKALDYSTITSPEFAQQAQQEYTINESAYNSYVNFARKLDQEEYTVDGDGTFNFTEDGLKAVANLNDVELSEMYDGMDDEQKRMLGFDNINSELDYVNYVRKKKKEYDDAHSGAWYGFTQFWKGFGKAFVSGLMDIVKIPLAIVSIAGAAFTGGFDNSLSKTMGGWMKKIDEGTSDKIHVDPDSLAGKIGGWIGTATEMAVEMVGTAGIGTAVKAGTKVAVKMAEKGVEKALEKGTEKAITKATAKVATRASRLMEKDAVKMVAKGETLGAEHVVRAADKLAPKLTREGLTGAASEQVEKALASASDLAVQRLVRKGAIKADEKMMKAFAAKYGIKESEEAGVKATEKATEEAAAKGAEEATVKAGEKATERVGEQTSIQSTKKVVEKTGFVASTKEAAKTLGKWTGNVVGVGYRRGGVGRRLVSGNVEKKVIDHMLTKSPLPTRIFKKSLGIGVDPITKLFGLKAFSNSVQQNQEKGMGGKEALARAILSMASTNLVWGSLGGKYASKIEERLSGKMMGKTVSSVTKKAGSLATAVSEKAPAVSKVVSYIMKTAGHTLKTTLAMQADKTLQQDIEEIWAKGQGIWDPIKKSFQDNITNINSWTESLASAFVMHMTSELGSKAIGGAYSQVGKRVWGNERSRKSILKHMDELMGSEKDGYTAEVYQAYKDMTRMQSKEWEGVPDDDIEFLDQVVSNLIASGGATGEKAERIFIRASARSWTGEVKLNTMAIIDDHMEAMQRHNNEIKNRFNERGIDMDRPWDVAGSAREFFEWTIMNNYNLLEKDGELPADAKEAGVNNFQPEELYVAASYVAHDISLADLNKKSGTLKADYFKNVSKRVRKIKNLLGKENFNELITMKHADIKKVVDLLEGEGTAKEKAKKLLKFKSDLAKMKQANENAKETIANWDVDSEQGAPEFYADPWKIAMDNNISVEELDNLTGQGVTEANVLKQEIVDAAKEMTDITTPKEAEAYVKAHKDNPRYSTDAPDQKLFIADLNQKIERGRAKDADKSEKLSNVAVVEIVNAWKEYYPDMKLEGEAKEVMDAFDTLTAFADGKERLASEWDLEGEQSDMVSQLTSQLGTNATTLDMAQVEKLKTQFENRLKVNDVNKLEKVYDDLKEKVFEDKNFEAGKDPMVKAIRQVLANAKERIDFESKTKTKDWDTKVTENILNDMVGVAFDQRAFNNKLSLSSDEHELLESMKSLQFEYERFKANAKMGEEEITAMQKKIEEYNVQKAKVIESANVIKGIDVEKDKDKSKKELTAAQERQVKQILSEYPSMTRELAIEMIEDAEKMCD